MSEGDLRATCPRNKSGKAQAYRERIGEVYPRQPGAPSVWRAEALFENTWSERPGILEFTPKGNRLNAFSLLQGLAAPLGLPGRLNVALHANSPHAGGYAGARHPWDPATLRESKNAIAIFDSLRLNFVGPERPPVSQGWRAPARPHWHRRRPVGVIFPCRQGNMTYFRVGAEITTFVTADLPGGRCICEFLHALDGHGRTGTGIPELGAPPSLARLGAAVPRESRFGSRSKPPGQRLSYRQPPKKGGNSFGLRIQKA